MHKRIAIIVAVTLSVVTLGNAARAASQSSSPVSSHHGKVGEVPEDLQRLDPRFTPTFKDGKMADAVKGIWRSRGYGYVIDLTSGQRDVYIETGKFCWHTELGKNKEFYDSPAIDAFHVDGKNRMTFTGEPGGTYQPGDIAAGHVPAIRKVVGLAETAH